jgi:glycyl-tRNA synthetase (class II)
LDFSVFQDNPPPPLQSHPKFKSVAEVAPLLYSRALQMGDEKKPQRMALGAAVADGIIANETLAYFIGRTYLFAQRVGLNPDRVRFRQHLQHEMAHYAEDCWDFEVECSYGWVECAGLADRSAYDLNVSPPSACVCVCVCVGLRTALGARRHLLSAPRLFGARSVPALPP